MYQIKNSRNEKNESKIRYEIALSIAQQEYLLQIERIKNLDEKIEKFLVVAGAFIAAIVAILSSNAITSLSIHNNLPPCICSINGVIGLLILYFLYLSFQVFSSLLKGLRLTETRRMPNSIELINYQKETSLEWIHEVIEYYEQAKHFLNTAATAKIDHLKKGQDAIQKQVYILLFIIAIIFLKTIFI